MPCQPHEEILKSNAFSECASAGVMLKRISAYVLLVAGIAGLAVPLLPGIPLLLVGLKLLGPEHPLRQMLARWMKWRPSDHKMNAPLFTVADFWWLYVAFTALVLILLVLDLGIFHRKAHAPGFREAALWMCVWVGLALAFCFGLYYTGWVSAA